MIYSKFNIFNWDFLSSIYSDNSIVHDRYAEEVKAYRVDSVVKVRSSKEL